MRHLPFEKLAPTPWTYDDMDMSLRDANGMVIVWFARPQAGAYNADIVARGLIALWGGDTSAEKVSDICDMLDCHPAPWNEARHDQRTFTHDARGTPVFTILSSRGEYGEESFIEQAIINGVNLCLFEDGEPARQAKIAAILHGKPRLVVSQ